ncbi:hypothetical protein ACS0TY_026434 [Phlomoides rotata]
MHEITSKLSILTHEFQAKITLINSPNLKCCSSPSNERKENKWEDCEEIYSRIKLVIFKSSRSNLVFKHNVNKCIHNSCLNRCKIKCSTQNFLTCKCITLHSSVYGRVCSQLSNQTSELP